MSYNVDNVINVNVNVTPAGLGYANFGTIMCIVPKSDANAAVTIADYEVFTYSTLKEVADDGTAENKIWSTTSQGYLMAKAWFSQYPKPAKVSIAVTDAAATATAEENFLALREHNWWYFTAYDAATQSDAEQMIDAAKICEAERSFLLVGSTDPNVVAADNTTNVLSQLSGKGYRHCGTFFSSNLSPLGTPADAVKEADPYAGITLAARFATVNYGAANSVISGEFKKLPGVEPEGNGLSSTQYERLITTAGTPSSTGTPLRAAFYAEISAAGSGDTGRTINTYSTSEYTEYWDSVIDLDAFVNTLQVDLYNVLVNQSTKVPQTPKGQQLLQDTASQVCERFINNGYLGERVFTNPTTGEKTLTDGYYMLSSATDILKLTDAERRDRKSAPIQVMIFPAGAIHSVNITVDVM